jgi:hypothetical protein
MKKTILLTIIAVLSVMTLYFVGTQANEKKVKEEQQNATRSYITCREKLVSSLSLNSNIKNISFNSLDKQSIEADFNEYSAALNTVQIEAGNFTKCVEQSNITSLEKKSSIDESARNTVLAASKKEVDMANNYINEYNGFMNKKAQYLKIIDYVNTENYIGLIAELASYLSKGLDQIKNDIPNDSSKISEIVTGLSTNFVNSTKETIQYYSQSNKELENALSSIIKA